MNTAASYIADPSHMPTSRSSLDYPALTKLHQDSQQWFDAALALPAAQQPDWPDLDHTRHIKAVLNDAQPIATPSAIHRLREQLAEVAVGNAFMLQGGHCAETFTDSKAPHIEGVARTLQQMALLLDYSTGRPVVTLGRLAGQYAKPRSDRFDSAGLPSYRGDIINSSTPSTDSRTPSPTRMLRAYTHSRYSARFLRALSRRQGMELRQVHARNAEFVRSSPAGERFQSIHSDVDSALRFFDAFRLPTRLAPSAEIFPSHEALLLDYESALLRQKGPWIYDVSSPFLWIGDRTRQLDGAHIAFAKLLSNPVGLKIGPSTTPEMALKYVELLDPYHEPGRLTLIIRMGSENVRQVLPPIVKTVANTGRQVIWQCDPMHGNTITSPTGYKTRQFDRIVDELLGFFEVHHELGTYPGGIHLELTGDDVTECLGGARNITEEMLHTRYHSACDPRLNKEQALELVFLVAEMLHLRRRP